jgi:hypothetical protein
VGPEDEDEEQVGVFVVTERKEEEESASSRGFTPWPHLPNEIKVHRDPTCIEPLCLVPYIPFFLGPQVAVLSWLSLRDVGACASVSHDMHALTKVPTPPTSLMVTTTLLELMANPVPLTDCCMIRSHCCGVRSQLVGGETPLISSRTA